MIPLLFVHSAGGAIIARRVVVMGLHRRHRPPSAYIDLAIRSLAHRGCREQ